MRKEFMDGTFDTAEELRRLIAEGRISQAALQAVTGVQATALASFLEDSRPGQVCMSTKARALSSDESSRMSILAAQLTQGLEIDDDDRLKGMLEGLMSQFCVTLQNIALLTRTSREEIENFLTDPSSVSSESKYALALRVSYLNLAIANAQRITQPE